MRRNGGITLASPGRAHCVMCHSSKKRATMAMRRRFGIGDEVTVKGIVRLIDLAGPGTITIELLVAKAGADNMPRPSRSDLPSFDHCLPRP